ncbi:hypothetical protein ElyMa_006109900 [Elysia marginata]|uniref:EF-hand domain-containing protein n=1 Tax=Elysia marginata TaxID=1093978 RepID=A0AAV4GUW1_9GAST|nr:hypothetical protein ElyMa_006109900 [Elysia marginata]
MLLTTRASRENICTLITSMFLVFNSCKLYWLENTVPITVLLRLGSHLQSSRMAEYGRARVSSIRTKIVKTMKAERVGVKRLFTRKGIKKQRHRSTVTYTVMRQVTLLNAEPGNTEEQCLDSIRTFDSTGENMISLTKLIMLAGDD